LRQSLRRPTGTTTTPYLDEMESTPKMDASNFITTNPTDRIRLLPEPGPRLGQLGQPIFAELIREIIDTVQRDRAENRPEPAQDKPAAEEQASSPRARDVQSDEPPANDSRADDDRELGKEARDPEKPAETADGSDTEATSESSQTAEDDGEPTPETSDDTAAQGQEQKQEGDADGTDGNLVANAVANATANATANAANAIANLANAAAANVANVTSAAAKATVDPTASLLTSDAVAGSKTPRVDPTNAAITKPTTELLAGASLVEATVVLAKDLEPAVLNLPNGDPQEQVATLLADPAEPGLIAPAVDGKPSEVDSGRILTTGGTSTVARAGPAGQQSMTQFGSQGNSQGNSQGGAMSDGGTPLPRVLGFDQDAMQALGLRQTPGIEVAKAAIQATQAPTPAAAPEQGLASALGLATAENAIAGETPAASTAEIAISRTGAANGATSLPRAAVNVPAPSIQVAVQISRAVQNGASRISVQLNPPELGRVDVKLDIGFDGRVLAVISAERPETLELLQRDARALERALQNAGLETDSGSLSFAMRQEEQEAATESANYGAGDDDAIADEDGTATELDLIAGGEMRLASNRALDIRV
jgi:flagellar hook-length control protein FliK